MFKVTPKKVSHSRIITIKIIFKPASEARFLIKYEWKRNNRITVSWC